jgi:hypothetical protein
MRADQFEDTSKANPRANLLFCSVLFSSLLFTSLLLCKTKPTTRICAIQGTFCNPKGVDWKETGKRRRR